MPLYVNEEGIIERISFNKPVHVARKEYEASWWQKALNNFWRMFSGY